MGPRIELLPSSLRPRERLRSLGAAALRDEELAAAVLGSGIRGRGVLRLAREILRVLARRANGEKPAGGDAAEEIRDPGGLPPATGPPLYADLVAVRGIGPAKAAAVAAALELARRFADKDRPRVREAEDVFPLVSFIAGRKQEHLVCVSLNGAHEVIATRVVTVGTVNANLVHPREVFADPIADRAAAVILAHNHPSGSLVPSPEDRVVTARLKEAGRLLGIEVLDHLIVTQKGIRRIEVS